MDPNPELVTLTPADADSCLMLSQEVNWNQTIDDWVLMLTSGLGVGLRLNGHLGATAILLPFETRVAWISMVVVTADWRRRGFASRLTNKCVEIAHGRGLVPMLDATPDGSTVYERIGFKRTCTILRYTRNTEREDLSTDSQPRERITTADKLRIKFPLSDMDIPTIQRLDRKMFGDGRPDIIENLVARNVLSAAVLQDDRHDATGFVIGRPGLDFHQAGPLFASSVSAAIALAEPTLTKIHGKICMDVPEDQHMFREYIERQGFEIQRPFYRMYHGDVDPGLPLESCYAIAGPELG